MLPRRPRHRPRRRAGLSLNRLIPNMLTLLSLCAGLSAVRLALEGDFRLGVAAILASAVLDGLDGRIARLIGATSRFGAELDSLVDFVCFGVVPGLLLYLWRMREAGRIGWAVVLIFAVCAALRLARFNTALEGEARPPWTDNYFVGVPAPAGAGLALLPLIASFELPPNIVEAPWAIGLWVVVIAGLMVSRLPTFAVKRLRVPNIVVLPLLLGVAVLASGLLTEPWLTLLGCGVAYLVSIPIAGRAVARLRRAIRVDGAAS